MPEARVQSANAGRTPAVFGIGRRLTVASVLIVLLFAALALLVSRQVGRMHTSSLRVLEEQRESTYSREIIHSLRVLGTRLSMHGKRGPSEESELLELQALVGEARSALAVLVRGPEGEDPSARGHVHREQRLFEELEERFDSIEAALRGDRAELPGTLAMTANLAETLHAEMLAAAQSSRESLASSLGRMRLEILAASLAALILLVLIAWNLRRTLVLPVQELREGAVRIAGGDLAHRVAITSRDEIGELAREFNLMAQEIATMRSSLEARVEERTREFVRAARLAGLGTMAAGIAHEINNPLASIATSAEGLERKLATGGASPEMQREYLQIIAREAYRAHEITSKLLDFARSERGPRVHFTVSELLREIAVLLEHRLRSRGLRLETDCDPGVPSVEGEPSECKQVLLNLLHNAIDASPPGGVVSVSCREELGELVIEVEDEGPGIPPGDLDRIFDPFFTTKAPGEGTGLGLAIVHRIVESHGGRIGVENTGHGARFRVRLPGARTVHA